MLQIDSLTDEQIASMAEIRDKWIKIGLCTDKADRPRAEAAIYEMYKKGGLEPPKKIVWCDSPFSQGLTIAILKEFSANHHALTSVSDSIKVGVGASVRTSVWNSVGNSVRDSVWDSVGDSVRDSVGNSVRNSVWNSVGDRVLTSIRDSVWVSVGDSLRVSVGDSVRDSVRVSVGNSVWDSVRDSVWDSVWVSVGNSVRDSVLTSVLTSVWNSVGNSVWNSVGNNVRDSVGNSVWNSVRDSIRDSVWDSVWDSVGNSVRNSVWNSVGDRVLTSVRDSVRDSVRVSVGNSVYGQHEASWLAFYEFFREKCGLLEQTHKLVGLWELAKSAGWAYPTKDICFVSERHTTLCRDERGRLHNMSGPAIQYPDGWEIYAVHGVRVPENIINKPLEITTSRIDEQRNTEIRRVMIDIYGQSRYLQDSGAKLLATDRFGKLWKKDLSDDEPIVMVEVKNSTPEPDGSIKDYFIRVPPSMATPQEAVAWTFNLPKDEYNPLVET